MVQGVEIAIEEINASGGIRGRKCRLITLDDGYEPSRTAPNMRRLIEKEQVLAIIGNVGTPTAVAAIPVANADRTPFVGAFSGAGILRKNPPDRYVVNFRASYLEEITAMVNALVEFGGLKPHEIAFFTQRDAYGDNGFASGIWALKLNGLKDASAIAHGRYERNTLAVENGLAEILLSESQPRAVIMVGAYAPCAAFISLAQKSGLKSVFLNVSFVGSKPLADALGPHGDGVIITQVVPHFDADLPIIRQYFSARKALNLSDNPTFGSLEGYIAMRVLRLGLESIRGSITREGVIVALEGLGEFDLGLGEPLRLSPEDHQACQMVWPTIIKAGKTVPLQWEKLGGMFKRQ
jgi:ABC-type branched-subunit amino acid transport system substrate-binding protein